MLAQLSIYVRVVLVLHDHHHIKTAEKRRRKASVLLDAQVVVVYLSHRVAGCNYGGSRIQLRENACLGTAHTLLFQGLQQAL